MINGFFSFFFLLRLVLFKFISKALWERHSAQRKTKYVNKYEVERLSALFLENQFLRTLTFEKIRNFRFAALKPKMKSHYRGHKMAVWLNLIPQLHQPGDDDVSMRHHHFHEREPYYYAGGCYIFNIFFYCLTITNVGIAN